MKKIFFLLIVSFLSISIFAQDTYLKWAKQFAGTSVLKYGRGMAIQTDPNGNVYTVGTFTGTIDFDPGPAVFNLTPISTDVYISKLDSAGKFLWAKQITGSFGTLTRSFTLDKDLNIYVTGTFQATVDFDPGPGVFNLTANGTADVFILKLTKDGDLIWVKQIGGPAVDAESVGTVTDAAGNIYFTGNYKGTVDIDPGPGVFTLTSTAGTFNDVYICKLDATGNFVWAGSIGASGQDFSFSISCDKLDNIYVTGYFRTTVDFDPGPAVFNLVSNGLEDMFMLKLNAAGNFVWARSIGGTAQDHMYNAVIDDAGNIYATGFFRSTVDFDPGPAVFNLTAVGGAAIFVLKLDAAGNFVWAKGMGGPDLNNFGYAVAFDKVGNIYTTGFFKGQVDFDPGPGTFMINSTLTDMFISKLDKNGNFVWAKSIGASKGAQGLGITVDSYLNIYTTGHWGGTADFDLETPTYLLTAVPVSDPFVLKIAQCAAPAFTTVNVTICPGQIYHAGGADQTTAGIYKDTLQTVIGCDSIIITNLSLYPKPNPDLGLDRNLCANETATISPGIFSNYLWHDNSTQPNYTINNTGKYWVTVTDANNCSATDTLNILAIDTLPTNFLPANQELCTGNVLRIAVGGYFTYLWSTGSIGDFIDINTAGKYYLTVKDLNLCTGTDSITIISKNCFNGIPNAFTPNGDTKNDIFKPTISQQVKDFSFIVYNRYGQKIFETHEYGKGWDGTYKGKDQQAGSYVYHIKFTNNSGWETVEKGSVLLIR